MINYKKGDLFNDNSQAIVNTVNCVGVMGRGIALQFKKRFPDNFKAYEQLCKRGEVRPGKMFVYNTFTLVNPMYIINFPTKRHWRDKSRMEDIEAGLIDLVNVIEQNHITSIALPPLGSGLGGLEWNRVKIKIEKALKHLKDVEINVYEPNGAPEAKSMVQTSIVPKMTQGRAALIGLISHYLDGLLDPFITLLEVHKLMYFLQISGEHLRLKYIKGNYGPYAENLSHVLHAIEGHMLLGYADGGNEPDKRLEVIPGIKSQAKDFILKNQDTLDRMNRVTKLVEGFETPFGLELLATVHWVVNNGAETLSEVIDETYKWNHHKKQFSVRQISIAVNRLTEQNWIKPINMD